MAKYTDNTKDYSRQLKRIHGGMAVASSQTVNDAADIIEGKYKKELQGFTLRNNFTIGAVKKYHSKATRTSGDFREIKNINSRVGVLKMKGGKDHYLKKQEDGAVKTGTSQTAFKIAFPMDSARTSDKRTKPIKGALQLQKSGKPNTLTFANGRKIGNLKDGFGASNGAQRWGILYKYTGLSGRGKQNANNRYGWDAKKPFFFVGMVKGLGIFQAVGNRIKMIRSLDKITQKITAKGKFDKSFKTVDDAMMVRLMQKNAKRIPGVK